jgi:hypothetical protein
MKGDLPWLVGFLGLLCQYKRILSSLGCSGQPSTKYFFLTRHIVLLHLSPSPSKRGRQSCRVGSLLISVSGPSPSRCFIMDFYHRARIPSPLPLRVSKTGRNHLKRGIYHPPPHWERREILAKLYQFRTCSALAQM